ncbi:MAG TPA: hypothetical protein VK137_17340, partial [Planctomycetaceae bacterium]|nr:hypothetical protein [Planctomycetaceae bacterium]
MMFPRIRSGREVLRAIATVGVCLLIGAVSPTRARADEPSLTELVGADVGLSVEINGLKTQLRELPSAEWFRRLQQLSFVRQWRQGSEFAKWQAGQASLEAMAGQPLDRFAAELFGESVLLAVSPSKSGKPVAVLLSRAEREDSWDRALRLWDQLEAHDVRTLSVSGHGLQRRRKQVDGQKGGSDIFTARLGRTLAISESEEHIRDVFARLEAASTAKQFATLAQSPQFQRAVESLPTGCAIRVVVNP